MINSVNINILINNLSADGKANIPVARENISMNMHRLNYYIE
jgi:hypothetical protein